MTKRPLLLAFLLAAFLILMLGERGLPASRQPELSDGETVTLTGIVEEIAEKENSRQIRLSHIYLSSDLSYQRQVLVYENQQTTLKIGYKVKAAGSYAPLEEASNPGQFDQKAYYEARGIGMVLKKAKLTVIEAKENIFFQKLYELRSFWAQNLEKITGKEEAALLKAMLLGEKSSLKKEQKELYQSGGISHILAISGVKTLKLDIPLVPETRINWAFVPLHIAIIYILKPCLDEEIIPRCRFPCSRGYLTKCINWQKK